MSRRATNNELKRKRSSDLDAAWRVVGALTAKIAGLKETDVLEEEERDWNAAVTSAPGSSASSSASPTSTPATSPISERAQSPLLWPRLSLTQAIHLATVVVHRRRLAAQCLRAIEKEQDKLRRRAKSRQRFVVAAFEAMQGGGGAEVRRVVMERALLVHRRARGRARVSVSVRALLRGRVAGARRAGTCYRAIGTRHKREPLCPRRGRSLRPPPPPSLMLC